MNPIVADLQDPRGVKLVKLAASTRQAQNRSRIFPQYRLRARLCLYANDSHDLLSEKAGLPSTRKR